MKSWLDKLCKPLEHPRYPQIQGSLVQYNGRKIIGKCAEGEIACQNNISYSRLQGTLSLKQLLELDIPIDLVTDIILPDYDNNSDNFNFDRLGNIGEYIWKLNDNSFTYKQIVEFLRTTFEDAV